MISEHALFPLDTVLFPGGPLGLRIFEARYLDMVSDCLRNDKLFGVSLISSGTEAGQAAETMRIGTLARIIDWDRLDNGLLLISARGETRFCILDTTVRRDQLVVARIERLADEKSCAVPRRLRALADLLGEFMTHADGLYGTEAVDYDDASWVSFRLAELLPVPLTRKQYFLEIEDPVERLTQIAETVATFSSAEGDAPIA